MENYFILAVPGVSFILVTECNDGQTGGLCCKTAASYKWVLENMKNVKWVFRATDDTFVHVFIISYSVLIITTDSELD